MSLRARIIELLGGEVPDPKATEPELTGDPCIDEGHDVIEFGAATTRAPTSRKCRRCGLWLPKKPAA